MSAQAAIAAKTAITALSLTGTAYSVTPRGRDGKNVLLWTYAGASALDDVKVDFSYRPSTSSRKSVKSTLRCFVPKTYTDSTTGVIGKVGDNAANFDFSFVETATAAERQKLVDIVTSVVCSAEFRDALINGNVMY